MMKLAFFWSFSPLKHGLGVILITDQIGQVRLVLEPQEFRQTLCDTAVMLAILTAFYLGVQRPQFS